MKLKTQPVKKQGSPTSMREANLALQDENERLKKEIKDLKESAGPNQNDLDLLTTKYSNEKLLLKNEIKDLKEKNNKLKETESKLKEEIESLNRYLTDINKNNTESSKTEKERIAEISNLKSELAEMDAQLKKIKLSHPIGNKKISKARLEEILNYCTTATRRMLTAISKQYKNSEEEWIKIPNTLLMRESTTSGAVAKFKKEIEFFSVAFHKKEAEKGRKLKENFYKLNLSDEAIDFLLSQ